jgi:hypothetical protein
LFQGVSFLAHALVTGLVMSFLSLVVVRFIPVIWVAGAGLVKSFFGEVRLEVGGRKSEDTPSERVVSAWWGRSGNCQSFFYNLLMFF